MAGWNWRLMRCGAFRLDGGAMFGILPKPIWTRLVEPDDRNRIPLQSNSLLLEREGRIVLIETGIGDRMSDKLRDIYALERRSILDALQDADCDPKDIDDVVVTHLHFDHAGGLTRAPRPGSGESNDPKTPPLTFPNARIVTQQLEWEDAKANRSTMHATYLPDHLTPEVAERLVLINGKAPPTDDRLHQGLPTLDHWFHFTEVAPGIEVFRVPGHTPGQQAVKIACADGRTLVYVPDVMPTAWHASPTANMAYDMEPYVSMLQRTALLELAARKGWLLCLDHDPGANPLFRVEHDPEKSGRHRLVPSG